MGGREGEEGKQEVRNTTRGKEARTTRRNESHPSALLTVFARGDKTPSWQEARLQPRDGSTGTDRIRTKDKEDARANDLVVAGIRIEPRLLERAVAQKGDASSNTPTSRGRTSIHITMIAVARDAAAKTSHRKIRCRVVLTLRHVARRCIPCWPYSHATHPSDSTKVSIVRVVDGPPSQQEDGKAGLAEVAMGWRERRTYSLNPRAFLAFAGAEDPWDRAVSRDVAKAKAWLSHILVVPCGAWPTGVGAQRQRMGSLGFRQGAMFGSWTWSIAPFQ